MAEDEVKLLCNRAISLAEERCLEEARSILLQADGLQRDAPRLQGTVKAAWCRFFDLSGDHRSAAKHGQEAVRLLEIHGDGDETAAAVVYLGSVRLHQRRYLQGLNLYNKAITLLRGTADPRLFVLARWGLGSALGFLERYEEARHSLLAAEARSRDVLTLVERGRLQKTVGMAHLYCGDYDQAEALFSLALRAFESVGRVDLIADYHNCMGSLHLARGNGDAARESYRRVVEALRNQALPQVAEAYYELSRVETAAGNLAEAKQHALAALKVARKLDSDVEVGRSMLALGQAFMGLERYEAAALYLRRASAILRKRGIRLSAVVAEDMLAQAERRCQSCAGSRASST